MSSDCSHVSLSKNQREIITGLLMGDGNISRNGVNPYLRCKMISENYLHYIDNEFGVLGRGVSQILTASESAEQVRESGFYTDADAADYSDVYKWCTVSHPEIQDFADWYSSGEKVFPKSLNLTPTVLKHWYCCDGHYTNNIQIAMSKESNNKDKIDELFENSGLPKPSNYNGRKNCDAVFTVDDSHELWQYMGEPLPDFEYKWPEEYRES